jgi:hypothetical protein
LLREVSSGLASGGAAAGAAEAARRRRAAASGDFVINENLPAM